MQPGLLVDVGPVTDGVVVISAAGSMDIETVDAFRCALHDAIDAVARAVVIDLTALDYFDSTGIASLVTARKQAEPRRVAIRVVASNGVVPTVLKMCGLQDIFPAYPSVAAALAT